MEQDKKNIIDNLIKDNKTLVKKLEDLLNKAEIIKSQIYNNHREIGILEEYEEGDTIVTKKMFRPCLAVIKKNRYLKGE